MTPIHELFARIRWDPEFGAAKFEIGYHDRIADAGIRVPLEHICFVDGERYAFEAIESDGTVHTIPYHRVRSVWRDGELIWHRHVPPA